MTAGRFSGASIINEFGASGTELIVGKLMNMESVAFLGRAQGLIGLIHRTIMDGLCGPMMPYFSAAQRTQQDIGTQFIRIIGNISALMFPIFACLIIVMDSVVALLYGPQWVISIEPARILGVGIFGIIIADVAGAAIAGMGESKTFLRIQLLGTPVKLSLVLLGCYFSLSHVALAIAVGNLLVSSYVVLILNKLTAFKWKVFFQCMTLSGFIAACAAGACLAFKSSASEMGDGIILAGCAFSSALGWLLGIVLTRHSLCLEVVAIARSFRKRWESIRQNDPE